MKVSRPDDNVAWARREGIAALAEKQLSTARRHFEYAKSLTPGDLELSLLIGSIQLQQRDPAARATFLPLADKHGLREGWFGLASAARLAGDDHESMRHLARGLSRHAPLRGPGFRDLCGRIARKNKAPGWCGLNADGVVSIGLTDPSAGLPEIRLDDRSVRCEAAAIMESGQIELRIQPRERRRLDITIAGVHLLGSPIAVDAIVRVEGFVAEDEGNLAGWIWHPGDPDTAPTVAVSPISGRGRMRLLALDETSDAGVSSGLKRRSFTVPKARLARFAGPLAVTGSDGRHLLGSPLDPCQAAHSAAAAAALIRTLFPPSGSMHAPVDSPRVANAADIIGMRPTTRRRRRAIEVIVPTYRGRAETMACLASVLSTVPAGTNVTVVEDASPDRELVDALNALAAERKIRLIRQPENRGFPAAVNAGLRESGDRDVVLLNSDTLVARGWLDRLQAACLSAADIGTVTPLTNDGSLVSYPRPGEASPFPDQAALAELDQHALHANGNAVIDLPTGVGFCLYVRRECLDAVGLMREDLFAQGYGEENDFCLRARHLGWRHVAAAGVFVAHAGGRSFGQAKPHLMMRNAAVLNRLYPGYDALVADFAVRDPLARARRQLDLARWTGARDARKSVILVTHGRGGGVQRRVRERCEALAQRGLRAIVLSPALQAGETACAIGDGADEKSFSNLVYALPREADAFLAVLRESNPAEIELHHFLDHDPMVLSLGERLGVPVDVVVHDFVWFCPRVSLIGANQRYCGEPAVAACEDCVADLGNPLGVGPKALRERSAGVLAQARRVVVPTNDTGRRLERHFPGLSTETQPWAKDRIFPQARAPRRDLVRICVAGAIGPHKGYETLLALGRDARARALKLEFVLAGYSHDDLRLLQSGRIVVTGPFAEGRCAELVRAQDADCGLLPSGIPETWSYVLSEFWQAGLPVAAFDIGAPAERIRATGQGFLLPLGLSVPRINDALLQWALARRDAASNHVPSVEHASVG